MKKTYKENELRNRKAICCLTDEEYREIKKDITRLGVTMSEYLRRILFDKRAHLIIDSSQLVEWLDRIAIESSDSTRSIREFILKPFIITARGYQLDELLNLVVKCIECQSNIGKCMKKLIKLMEHN